MQELISEILDRLADEIDISESQQGAIKRAYNSVAQWLNEKDTKISMHDINIFPQGSMMYGTAIKPISEDDYDVDLVCEFTKYTDSLSPSYVKKSVGERIKENDIYRNLLDDEGRRCWTLKYSDDLNFHMDILPAIPFKYNRYLSEQLSFYEKSIVFSDLALFATDKDKKANNYKYIPTNPRGYAKWFKERMNSKTNRFLLMDSIEKVPDYPTKTILQKAIQLLKRHRDVYFEDKDNDIKPISMIITTLTAECYNGETDLYDFICSALHSMKNHIERDGQGKCIINNPVMPQENFADKWKENPLKEKAFFNWLKRARKDFDNLKYLKNYYDLDSELKRLFSQKPVDRLMNNYQKLLQSELSKNGDRPAVIAAVEKINHRRTPPWTLPLGYRVIIKGEMSTDDENYESFSSGEQLDKNIHLRFFPMHSLKLPYKVRWQITNTGQEAKNANCLRGVDFECSELEYKGILCGKKEYTEYTGIHYVQCFIIRSGQCIGVSLPFVVNIK